MKPAFSVAGAAVLLALLAAWWASETWIVSAGFGIAAGAAAAAGAFSATWLVTERHEERPYLRIVAGWIAVTVVVLHGIAWLAPAEPVRLLEMASVAGLAGFAGSHLGVAVAARRIRPAAD